MKKTVWIIVAVVIVLAIGGYVYYAMPKNNNPQTSEKSQSTKAVTEPNTIVFDGTSFSPSTLTVKSGTTVTIKNTSSSDMQFDSDPHPIHTNDTELNVGAVAPGQSMTFTPTKTGTFGYHDHLDPSIIGTIVVE